MIEDEIETEAKAGGYVVTKRDGLWYFSKDEIEISDGLTDCEAYFFIATEEKIAQRIRRMAKRANVVAIKSRRDRMWYFSTQDNLLISDPDGLNDFAAWLFLS